MSEVNIVTPDKWHHRTLPSPREIIKQVPWKIDDHNAGFLSGRTGQPSPEYRKLSSVEIAERYSLPRDGPKKLAYGQDDIKKIVGDIDHALRPRSYIMRVETDCFKMAERQAAVHGFLPARAGEFLQIMWLVQENAWKFRGWFYCYKGRMPGYGILADNVPGCIGRRSSLGTIIFDTHIPSLEDVSSNMENNCFFVKR